MQARVCAYCGLHQTHLVSMLTLMHNYILALYAASLIICFPLALHMAGTVITQSKSVALVICRTPLAS